MAPIKVLDKKEKLFVIKNYPVYKNYVYQPNAKNKGNTYVYEVS